MPASQARNGEPLRDGHIFVAPPDQHLTLAINRGVVLTLDAKEHRHRPAIDPLFRSAAEVYGPSVLGLVLSGSGHDGAAGLNAIGRAGGLTVVQDPKEAAFPGMPLAAIESLKVDHVMDVAGIAALIVRWA